MDVIMVPTCMLSSLKGLDHVVPRVDALFSERSMVIMVGHGCLNSELIRPCTSFWLGMDALNTHCAKNTVRTKVLGTSKYRRCGKCCVCQHFLRQQKQHSCARIAGNNNVKNTKKNNEVTRKNN